MNTPEQAVLEVYAGTPDQLYDLRYPGVLEGYRQAQRDVGPGRARFVLEHTTEGHRLEVTVTVTPVAVAGARPANAVEVEDVLLTFAGAPVMADPRDRGALEHYHEVGRRDEGGATVLTLVRRGNKGGLEVALRVRPVT